MYIVQVYTVHILQQPDFGIYCTCMYTVVHCMYSIQEYYSVNKLKQNFASFSVPTSTALKISGKLANFMFCTFCAHMQNNAKQQESNCYSAEKAARMAAVRDHSLNTIPKLGPVLPIWDSAMKLTWNKNITG